MISEVSEEEPLALRLARYLKEFVGLRTTTVRDIDKYEAVLWFHGIPQERESQSPAWNDDVGAEAPWLEVHKQQFLRPPEPPSEILGWIDGDALKRASTALPPLLPSIFVPDAESAVAEGETPPLVMQRLEDHPDVTLTYERFRPTWESWSVEHRRRQAIQAVYADLFRLHTQIRKQGELLELVLGLGLLEWDVGGGTGKSLRVRRHVVTAGVDLHFDSSSGVIQLRPATDGAKLRLEDDMLDAEFRPERSHYTSVNEQLDEIGDSIWDKSLMHAALRSWAGSLHADSQWSPDLQPIGASRGRPSLSFAPALILRSRSQAGMLRIYEALIQRLATGQDEVPPGWRALVQDEDDLDPGASQKPDEPNTSRSPSGEQQVFFPLPANREQRRIVEAIDQRRGVLVQGPPGTGKSHTIANLVCHLLATGKRVLITAETGRALEVLKQKLPEEIQHLCVCMLGQGGDAFAELNSAIQGITTRQAAFSPGAYDDRIAEIDHEIDTARRTLAAIDTELRSLREDETCPHTIANGTYVGTASALAQRIANERATYGWLQLPRSAPESPPLANNDLLTWLAIRRGYEEPAIADAGLQVVASADLPEPAEFATAVTTEHDAQAAVEDLAALRGHRAYLPILHLASHARGVLAESLRELEQRRRELDRRSGDWLKRAIKEALEGRQALWHALHEWSIEIVDRIAHLLEDVGAATISIPETRDPRAVRSDAAAAAAYLQAGGKWKRLGMFTPKQLKERSYLGKDVTVDGTGATTPDLLRTVCAHIDLSFTFAELEQSWSAHGGLPSSPDHRLRLVAIREHLSVLDEALTFADSCAKQARTMGGAPTPIPEPDWLSDDAQDWLRIIDAASVEERHRVAAAKVTGCLRDLRALRDLRDTHPVVERFITAVEQRDVTAYSEAHAALIAIEKTREDQRQRAELERALDQSVPGLTAAVAASLHDRLWDEHFERWEDAWSWAIADGWLSKRSDLSYLQELHQRRRETESNIGTQVGDVAALRAWKHFFAKLTPSASSALRGWRAAVKAMGKGTGRSSRQSLLRREARAYMDQCRDAIPVWIMPRYLVAEMLEPAPGRYDLVIVDEASQLGIESLFLFYIAKKMVVVGDDQQISPYGVGIADAAISGLRHHYLQGMPHPVALSAQSSLYGNAQIRFGQSIVLREHFRCMPEIIQFSNDLCYASNGTPLDPLRTYPANRLRPLVVRHVPDGYRTGGQQHAQNPAEADAVVAQIVACINDPRYAGRTMGVISLQGEAQAKLIERKLLETVEPEVIEERRLICGDAYAFQGDERHVMFLSMVAAPGETRIGVLSGDSARQRFNVAASRAQDQLWLFHSATPDVLSPACMRHRLLSYMLDPAREATQIETQHFDSKFEREVFRHISERGFHVRTQVCVGDPTNHRYRIDLVVEGMQGRLAVECDGDEWHGPDRYEQDMARQRDLERAGWQFVRIRGGDFYRDQAKAMESVWAELDRLGIRPGGIDTAAAEPPNPADLGQILRPDSEETATRATTETEGRSGSFVQAPVSLVDEDDAELTEDDDDAESDASLAPEPPIASTPTRESSSPVAQELEVSLANPGSANAYVPFEGTAGPDPRTSSATQVAEGLTRIIKVEGPMCAKRAYDIYLRGCGIRRLGGEIKKAMNRALNIAIRQGAVLKEDERGTGGLLWSVVRAKGQPAVYVRERGPRVFEEIPPSELQLVARRLSKQLGFEPGSDAHLRAILDQFELVRLTPQVSAGLNQALAGRYAYVDLVVATEGE